MKEDSNNNPNKIDLEKHDIAEKNWKFDWSSKRIKIIGIVALILVIFVTVLAVVLTGSEDNVSPDPAPGPDPEPVIVVPDPPNSLKRDDSLTNQEQVGFTWSAPKNDGGA